jgi:hypothetical protein
LLELAKRQVPIFLEDPDKKAIDLAPNWVTIVVMQ